MNSKSLTWIAEDEQEKPDTRANAYQAGIEFTWKVYSVPFYHIERWRKREWEMPREFVAPDGRIFMRTKLLCQEQAERFASCLQANVTRFCDVECTESDKAKGEKAYFVQFRPVSSDRQFAQYQRQNDARRVRAMEEGACYVFALDIDGERPFYWTFNPKSGETYQTDSMTCSCPDFHYRCKKLIGYGVLCKHIQALLHAYELGEVLPLADVYDTPEWKAKHPLCRPHFWQSASSIGEYEEARP